ncbi:HNH endonuclease signature motif containing protein [Agreia bicolorata]|uniref:HNH nuclease domain-containing protein n=1 Tax=Agreia bicolorata TaxID=110935 RepID=A0ABR5CGN8_9MICO|nr:HNH endonuclease signature motif containing protein [Agreia bicolorata]KJC64786.1 hypothetical protein TZ00_03630 [Agreia bicolorata]
MDLHDASLGDIAARLRELLDEQRGAGSAAVSGDGLLEAVHAWEEIGRAGDAARMWVAAEVEHESRRELEGSGLAYRHGFATAKKLVAATANISERTAAGRMILGRQVRSSISPTGLSLPSRFPEVERAVFSGALGVDAASIICRTLSEVVSRVTWSEAVDEAERCLVDAATEVVEGDSHEMGLPAPRHTVDGLARLASRIREYLDPDGAEPRDAVKQQLRGFSYPKVGADGMARGRYAFPPLQLGMFLAAVDSILSPRTADPEAPRFGDGGVGERDSAVVHGTTDPDGLVVVDSRTSEQKLLDAVMALIEMAAASPAASRLNGSAPTANVHVTVSDLEAGSGVGWIDGSTEPIPMSTIQMLGCDADLTATVFGSSGQVLSQGKTKRLASRRQRRALAARDGGCVIPGCTVPPSRCQAHHVVPWVSSTFLLGRTDIDNLALLCPFHHATIHTSAWQLVMINGKPHVREPGWRGRRSPARAAGQQRAGWGW